MFLESIYKEYLNHLLGLTLSTPGSVSVFFADPDICQEENEITLFSIHLRRYYFFWLRQEAQEVTHSFYHSVCPSVIFLNSSLCQSGKYFVLLFSKLFLFFASPLFTSDLASVVLLKDGEFFIVIRVTHTSSSFK